MTHNEDNFNGYRRRYDDMSFIRKNWQIIVVFGVFLSGYSVLSFSVNSHHDIDNARDAKAIANIEYNNQRIVRLEEAVKAIPRIEDKVDRLLERLPRKKD